MPGGASAARRAAALAAAAAVVALYARASVQQNRSWRSQQTLFRSALGAYPDNAEMYRGLAAHLTEFGASAAEREEALQLYEASVRLDEREGRPTPARVTYNIGVAHMHLGNDAQAERFLRRAARDAQASRRPGRASGESAVDANARHNLGVVLTKRVQERREAAGTRDATLDEAAHVFGEAYTLVGGPPARRDAVRGYECDRLVPLLTELQQAATAENGLRSEELAARGDDANLRFYLRPFVVALAMRRDCV